MAKKLLALCAMFVLLVFVALSSPIAANEEVDKQLLEAAYYGNEYVDRVKAALKQGADVNTKDEYGWTPLHFAASGGCVEVMKVLLHQPKVNIDAKSNKGLTPLHAAVESNFQNTEIVYLLLNEGADVNALNKSGKTPLDEAQIRGKWGAMNLIQAFTLDHTEKPWKSKMEQIASRTKAL